MTPLIPSNKTLDQTDPRFAVKTDPATVALPTQALSRIFQFLSITGLQRAACVCKAWKVIASKDSVRKIVLEKILNGTKWGSSHEVIAAYNIEHLNQAAFIFVGEDHGISHKKINAPLINEVASDSPIALFVEGSTAMKIIDSPLQRENVKEYTGIEDHLMSNIQIFGWDMDEKTYTQKKLAVWELEKDGERELPQNKVKVLNASIKECQSILASIAPELFNDRVIDDDDLDIDGEILCKTMCKLSGKDYKDFILTYNRLIDLITKRVRQHLEDTMPERTECATFTVETAAQLQKEKKLPPKAVFIQGQAHLQRKIIPQSHNPESRAWSLKIFYQEVSKHKAVILFPKE